MMAGGFKLFSGFANEEPPHAAGKTFGVGGRDIYHSSLMIDFRAAPARRADKFV